VNWHISNPRNRLGPLPAAPLVVHRRYLAMAPRPMPAAPCRYLIMVPMPLPAAALVAQRRAVFWFTRYLIVVPRPLPVVPLVARRRYLAVVLRPLLGRCTTKQGKY
jgi:hypothetical protein